MLQKILKSRTIWTLVFLVAFNSFAVIQDQLHPIIVLVGNAFFGALAAYYKLNPSQYYKK